MKVDLSDFISHISTNYTIELYDGNVELVPYNNMQHRIIKDGDFDETLMELE